MCVCVRVCVGANASAESCDQLTLADQAEISRLQRENEDLRAMLPSREEMRLMRSQVEDATAMKKSFEVSGQGVMQKLVPFVRRAALYNRNCLGETENDPVNQYEIQQKLVGFKKSI